MDRRSCWVEEEHTRLYTEWQKTDLSRGFNYFIDQEYKKYLESIKKDT